MRKTLLVYGDSLSWGIVPGSRARHPVGVRWPTVLEGALQASGLDVHIIEDCLNGRRTVWDDPYKAGRNGLAGLAQRMEINAPLDGVLLMLGNNDFQAMHPNNAWLSAQGIATLVDAIRSAPIEPGMPVPPILIIAPPPLVEPTNPPRNPANDGVLGKFAGGHLKCVGLAEELAQVAALKGCAFFDAGTVISASPKDGVHLEAEAHLTLGQVLVAEMKALFTLP